MADPREDDEPDPQASGDTVPLWRRLDEELKFQKARIGAAALGVGTDVSPVMLDRFEVRRLVGAGGRGVVFEGFDPVLGRRVALKVCKMVKATAATEIEHEARALAKLSHPNIVAVYEIVRVGTDVVLVMDFIEGRTLRRWLAETNPSWRDVIARFMEAGWALVAVHSVGLEHADFKPDNVMIDDEGRVRVVDFGVARGSIGSREASKVGTLPYMAPERLLGRPGGPAADVYAFSVSLWEALYGVRPFDGPTSHALVQAIVSGEPAMGKFAVLVPDAVRAVLARGFRARARERTQSMEALLRALADACETASSRRARWWRRLRGVFVAGLVVAAGMGGMLMRAPEPTPVAAPQPGVVAQNLALAVEAVRAGHPDSAITYLELARSRARADNDVTALREVAAQAEALGDEFDQPGNEKQARKCWEIAADIFTDLGNPPGSAERSRLNLKMSRNR